MLLLFPSIGCLQSVFHMLTKVLSKYDKGRRKSTDMTIENQVIFTAE